MEIHPEQLEQLFDSVCQRARHSPAQSRGSIIQDSRAALAKTIVDAKAVHVLAASSLVRNDPERSLALLHRNPDAVGSNATGNRLAGYAELVRRDLDRARQYFDEAVRLDPHQSDCWSWLGQIAEQESGEQLAADYYCRGAVFDDQHYRSTLALSRLYAKSRKLKDAIHTVRVALLRDRRSPRLNLALARLLEHRSVSLGRSRRYRVQGRIREEALACYIIVNAASPSVQTWIAQGRLHQQLSDHGQARLAFEKAAELDPDAVGPLTCLAGANVDFGAIETALEQFETAIKLDPSRANTHFRYTRAKKFKTGPETDAYLELLNRQLFSIDQRPVHNRPGRCVGDPAVELNFAIAKVYDDLGRHDEAWHHYQSANRFKVRCSRSPSQSVDLIGPIVQTFDEPYFRESMHVGASSGVPVFIVGMPRSGTTLTEQILSSHPQIAGAGELGYLHQMHHEIHRLVALERSAKLPLHQTMDAVDPSELRRMGAEYLGHLEEYRLNHERVTDKMPTNFMHLGLIATLFPGATVVHCRRNPMDVMVSCFCQNLNAPFCDLDQLVEYHRQYRALMRHWERVLPIKILTQDYEDLVADPEPHTRRLIQHCGLDWSDECLRFQNNDRAVHTPSKWQVRQPMYRSSVEKWRRFEKQLAPIAGQVCAELEREEAVAVTR